MKKAYLLLADGTLFEGVSVGAEGASIAEIVFNTGMAGYQEVLTDPSYYGQSVCMTYPLIGNYGLNAEDFESRKCWVSGFIMREACAYPSNWRCDRSLDEYLKSEGIVGLAGIDTRRLTRILRNSGVMNGILYSEGYEPTEQQIADHLYTAGQPDPDLIIRPSGEMRVSNFLLWQSAYTEYVVSDILWPDFTPEDLEKALDDYCLRHRRFGGVEESR